MKSYIWDSWFYRYINVLLSILLVFTLSPQVLTPVSAKAASPVPVRQELPESLPLLREINAPVEVPAQQPSSTYTLTIAVNGNGSTSPVPGTSAWNAGSIVPISATASQGYVFASWSWTGGYLPVANPTSVTTTVTIDTNKTVTANFLPQQKQPQTFVLTMDVNPKGVGTTSPPVGTSARTAGTTVPIQAVAPQGYIFASWSWTGGGNPLANPLFASTTLTMDMNRAVTANFLPRQQSQPQQPTFVLTVAVNGQGITNPAPGTSTYTAITSMPISAVASQGYVFASWAWTGSGSPIDNPYAASTTLTVDSSRRITANFRSQQQPPQTFVLTLAVNGKGATMPVPGTSVWNEGTSVPISATASRGYVFASWAWTGGGNPIANPYVALTTVTMDAKRTITANFQPQQPAGSPAKRAAVQVNRNQDGEIRLPNDRIVVRIPKGAMPATTAATTVELIEKTPPGSTGMKIVRLFELNARVTGSEEKVTQFGKDIEISIKHDPRELAGLDLDSLRLYYLDEKTKQWLPVQSKYDRSKKVLTATVNHFTNFGEQANPIIVRGPGRVLDAQVAVHSGAAILTYPIELPPGPGGFRPRLELTYNSASVDEMKDKRAVGSWVGIGWTLHPGRISYASITNQYFLDFDDGSYELVSTDGINYRTNPETYLKITRDANTWEMRDREGIYYKFGGTSYSVQYLPSYNGVYRWDLYQMRDTNDNQMTVTYVQDMKGTAPDNWVRSAYPEYLTYGNVQVRFISSYDEYDPTDGYRRRDNPKTFDAEPPAEDYPAPKVMENRKLEAIEIKVSGEQVRKYSFTYNTTDSQPSTDYGGIYYSGKHTLTSIIQKGVDWTLQLPAMILTYQDLQTYRRGNPEESEYVGNPGNPAYVTPPYLIAVNRGYGGSETFSYTQKPDTTAVGAWTREVVTARSIDSGIGAIQTYNYTYTSNKAFSQPYDVVKDNTGSYVYVADRSNHRILKFDRNGNFITRWGSYGSGDGQFNNPQGVAVDSSGNVYVADGYNHRIQKFDSSGSFILKWGINGPGNGQFSYPWGITLDSSNYVYVADEWNHRVQKFDSSSNFIWSTGSYGSANGFFNRPSDVLAHSNGYIYVVDRANQRIQKYNSSGIFISTFGGQFTWPTGIASDISGYIYITDEHRVQKFDSNGIYSLQWGTHGWRDWEFDYPFGITVDGDGYVYVADTNNHRIKKFTSSGRFILGLGGYNNPNYLGKGWDQKYRGFDDVQETDAAGNYIKHWFYTTGKVDGKDADRLTGREYRTQWFSSAGSLLKEKRYDWTYQTTGQTYDFSNKWSSDGKGDGLFAPFSYGVALSNDGSVYTTDDDWGQNQRVQKYNEHGNFVLKWGSYGSNDGQFSTPQGVAVDSQGNVYVAEFGNNRIQKFDSNGNFIRKWGQYGSGNGDFNGPEGIAVDIQGYVYVVDTGNDRIQKFDSSGVFITKWGSSGSGDGQFDDPGGIAVDSQGNVYVTDSNNNRVQKFNSSGGFITKWGVFGYDDGKFYYPLGIAVDSFNSVYVADFLNYRIQKFDSSGNFLFKWNLQHIPVGVAVSPSSLYVNRLSISSSMVEEFIYNWTVRLSQVDEATGSKTSRIRYEYDGYGNIVTEYLEGDVSTNSDDGTIHRVFYPNTTSNILSKPAQERVYATITGDIGGTNLKKETFYYYDSSSSYSTPPIKGNLTRLEQKKDASNSINSYFTYDSYGNMLTSQDPKGNMTIWTYDTTHHTYPIGKTYPITGLAESYTWDFGTDNMLSMTDVNSLVTYYEYDTFKRLLKVIKPGDTSTNPSVRYSYNSWGSINQQHVKTETRISGSDYLWQSAYFDGLGRVVQTQARGETGHTIIARTTAFNNRSLVDKVYVSQDLDYQASVYVAPASSWKYTAFTYDGLDRVTSQAKPDSTVVNHDYSNPWQELVTNERGYRKDYSYDAFSRLTQVKERGVYTYSSQWGSYGSGNNQFIWPTGIASDASGNIYVTNEHRVQKFDSNGNYILQWGNQGWTTGQFSWPFGIAVDKDGYVYVADTGNNRIQKFTSNGGFVLSWGDWTTFNQPWDVAIDDNNDFVYVVDRSNNRIQKFNKSGVPLGQWGVFGSGDGQFKTPQGVAVDSQGNVYVTDMDNWRVQKFSSSGTFLLKWGNWGFGDGQFNTPWGISVDSHNNVYVADEWSHRVQKFDSQGNFIQQWGGYGTGNGYFNRPSDLLGHQNGYVYVVDRANFRIQKFEGSLYSTTIYSYDVLGNLTQARDNNNNTANMTYDWLSRKTAMTDPDMGSWSYVYDNNSNLTSQTDAKSQTTNLSYDALNRLTGKTSSGMANVTFTYDSTIDGNKGKGLRTGMSDGSGTMSYKYDTWGRLIEEKRTVDTVDYVTGFAYDGASRLTTITYPATGEIVTQGYNLRGLPYSLSSNISGSLVSSSQYNQLALPTEINLGNNTRTTYGYWDMSGSDNNAGGYYGKLWKIKTVRDPLGSPATFQEVKHTWDVGGNLAQRQDALASETENFTYDNVDRLTSVSVAGGYSETYSYNQIGNITSKGGQSYTYGSKPHAVTAVGATSYTYDNNGNMITRGSQTLTWDVENRLTGVTGGVSYVYDGNGFRVKKTEGGTTILYVNKYYEKNTSTGIATLYYYQGDKMVAYKEGTTLRYVYKDHLTGTSVGTDTSGTVVGTIKYKPYGETRSSSGILPSQKFTGQRLDDVGLYYYGARYYDQGIGRFISADTIVPNPYNPQSLNRYSYVLNNPLAYIDPSGNWTLKEQMYGSGQVFSGYGHAVVNTIKGTIQLIVSPIETANAIKYAVTHPVATFEAVKADYIEKASSNEGIGEIIGEGLITLIPIGGIAKAGSKTTALVEKGVGWTGKIGENALKELGGESQVFFRTSRGGRFVDQLIKNVAYESKVGRTNLTKMVQEQIDKDVELIAQGQIRASVWNFYRSPVTGEIGPSPALEKALKGAGIDFNIYP